MLINTLFPIATRASAITTLASSSNTISFLILGDWGNLEVLNQSRQNAIAMNKVAKEHSAQLVMTVGDNFYDNGTSSTTDPLWKSAWTDVYGFDYLGKLPWWAVLGNHDWVTNPMSEIEYSSINPNWILPDFFSERILSFAGFTAVFLFIDTDLLNYGYSGFRNDSTMFERFGWTKDNNTAEIQLEWIDTKLANNSKADFLFVVGHHNLGTCRNNKINS